jgi:uncharacterized lipoprotein YajG
MKKKQNISLIVEELYTKLNTGILKYNRSFIVFTGKSNRKEKTPKVKPYNHLLIFV